MRYLSESGNTFIKTIVIFAVIGLLSVYGIRLCQQKINDIYAENIINGVWERAQQEKTRVDPVDPEDAEAAYPADSRIERKGYAFVIADVSTPTLIKVETEKKMITPDVCKMLKKKLKTVMWRDIFIKVLVVDRMGDEKTDILIYNCPQEKIPALRFYTKFTSNIAPEEEETEEVIKPETGSVAVPMPAPAAPISMPKSSTPRSTYTPKTVSCPAGTSTTGAGAFATAGCRCNNAGETWNGKSCETKACPAGSSRKTSGHGAWTNVSGCRCNDETPLWSNGRCIKPCAGDKVFDDTRNECVCPDHTHPKRGEPDICVECNTSDECPTGSNCIGGRCLMNEEDFDDCRWGICQSCDDHKMRQNLPADQGCEVAGLNGMCNGNGTCYPTEGRRCATLNGCPKGQFCNYGGKFNATKKQKGKFGQTPNVCQNVAPEELTYKNVTYYYNSQKDLKSWCRAANNKPNCLWGYLAKSGAESWCASLGKRLLTRAEMAKVWNELKKELPQTYTGYAYWVQEGVWIEGKTGKLSFGNGHPDGYGGRGGVVCR
ncbi:MAG: hypothetical protein ACI4OR_03485 [Alphaproteobacteria bacterium]